MDSKTLVSHVMTPSPRTINIDQPLSVARKLMLEHNCRHLPVMDGSALVGIISDRDIGIATEVLKGTADDILVRSVFVEQPFTVTSSTPLHEVLREMVTLHIGSALVVDKGKLVGIFTSMDGCSAFAEFLRNA